MPLERNAGRSPMTSTSTKTSLEDAHDRHHARLHDGFYEVIGRWVTPERFADGVDAQTLFRRLCGELEAAVDLEERAILPAYRTLPSHAPQGRPEVVDGDHTILRRTIVAIEERFAAIGATPTQREVLEALPLVYRLIATLEHHTEREQRHVYPSMGVVLSPTALAEAEAVLRGLMEPQD